MQAIPYTPAQLETIIAHHEAHGANPCAFVLDCPCDALKFHRTLATTAAHYRKLGKKAPKLTNELGAMRKLSHVSALINFRYQSNVNAQRVREEKEPDFKARANWFRHVSPAIVEHKSTGERYVFLRVLRDISAPVFSIEGEPFDRSELLSLLPAVELTNEERAAYGMPLAPLSSQELDSPIEPRAVKLANVQAVTVDGFTYVKAAPAIVEGLAPVTACDYTSQELLAMVLDFNATAPARQ